MDKQPSGAITIQEEYSYFSGINLSLLTYGDQSDCSRCINLPPSLTPCRLRSFDFIIDLVEALGAGHSDPKASLSGGCRAAGVQLCSRWRPRWWRRSRNVALPSGPLPPGSICRAGVVLRSESSAEQTESLIRDSFSIDQFLWQLRGNTVFPGIFLYDHCFLHCIFQQFSVNNHLNYDG